LSKYLSTFQDVKPQILGSARLEEQDLRQKQVHACRDENLGRSEFKDCRQKHPLLIALILCICFSLLPSA